MKLGNINISLTGNSGVLIEDSENGKVIYIDPYNLQNGKKADVILITHPHYDHCSIQDISAIVKKGTVVIVPPDCQSKITKLKQEVNMQVIEIGDEISLEGMKIKAVPAYNLNKAFHPKNEHWHGYVLSLEGLEIYHAGDTDLIPEMAKLCGYHNLIAFLPVSGKFVMNVEEAVEAAKIIKPKIAVPMHWGSVAGTQEDADKFVEMCKESGIEARRIDS